MKVAEKRQRFRTSATLSTISIVAAEALQLLIVGERVPRYARASRRPTSCLNLGWMPPIKLGAAFASTAFCSGATPLFHLLGPQLHGPAGPARKRSVFECFPYVYPEPVLVKCSFLYTKDSNRPWSHTKGALVYRIHRPVRAAHETVTLVF